MNAKVVCSTIESSWFAGGKMELSADHSVMVASDVSFAAEAVPPEGLPVLHVVRYDQSTRRAEVLSVEDQRNAASSGPLRLPPQGFLTVAAQAAVFVVAADRQLDAEALVGALLGPVICDPPPQQNDGPQGAPPSLLG